MRPGVKQRIDYTVRANQNSICKWNANEGHHFIREESGVCKVGEFIICKFMDPDMSEHRLYIYIYIKDSVSSLKSGAPTALAPLLAGCSRVFSPAHPYDVQ